MSQQVKTPASAAGYTPATQDPDLRSQINSILIRDGHIGKIQEHLIHALHSHQSDWPTLVQNHALALLRSGEVSTFPALLRRVLDDIRADATVVGVKSEGKKAAEAGLGLPKGVVEEAVKVTRECLEQVVTVTE